MEDMHKPVFWWSTTKKKKFYDLKKNAQNLMRQKKIAKEIACYVQCWSKSINRKMLYTIFAKYLKILILKFKFDKKNLKFLSILGYFQGTSPTPYTKKNLCVSSLQISS